MAIRKILIIILFVLVVGFLAKGLFAESVTLTTYYPAPFGAYDRIRLVPRATLGANPNCNDSSDVGTMYYDNGLLGQATGVYVCQATAVGEEWVLVSHPTASSSQKLVCVQSTGNLGVCHDNPVNGSCTCVSP